VRRATALLLTTLYTLGASNLGWGAPAPPADHSLAEDAYIARGVPAPDRAWSGEDYLRAATLLKGLAEADYTELPRLRSPTSGALFARLVAAENIQMAASPLLSDQVALGSLAELMQGAGQVLSVYVDASQHGAVLDSELVSLTYFLLQLAAATAPIASTVISAIPLSDPSRPARLKGFEQMRQGFAAMVSGSLTTLTEHSGYRLSELIRLAHGLLATLPRLLPYLPDGVRRELPVRLRGMLAQEPSPVLRARLARLLTLAQAAVPGEAL
jgi:hypothetical protein